MSHTFQKTSDKLAIVGSHAESRDKGPWNDESYDLWVINEAPQHPWCKRYTASINIHRPETYHNPNGNSYTDHWKWLQEEHGKPIWMQDIDPEVPDSVKFPLEEMIKNFPAAKPNGEDPYFTSSPAYLLALGLYLGYKIIHVWGVDLSSNTEYTFQANCWRYWVGVAKGMLGNNFRIVEGGKHLFKSKLYGYHEDPRVGSAYFKARVDFHESYMPKLKKRCDTLKSDLNEILMGKGDVKRFSNLFQEARKAYQELGALMGSQSTAQRLSERDDPIARQEYEWHAAKAQSDAAPLQMQMYSGMGKLEYVFNAWLQSGNPQARNQVSIFLDEILNLAQQLGMQTGLYSENVFYLNEFDQRLVNTSGASQSDELNAIQATEAAKK